ncbi:MAG: prephenate dehydrogenase/arogenate dehydrogenase family protein [Chitinispirillia bacterium]|nr:prephenate dehydrogenase/arogenate dehydrogenase family protein [Chitinispirillia bacterium]MCL2268704.1 prephenate dehydrogenase/arogenate dehydrogenase family protein [Chitinispirillia bacterium]
MNVDSVMPYNPKTVTVYSVGLLGGSIGAGLKKAGFGGKVIGLSSEKAVKASLDRGLIDEGHPYSDLPEVIAQTDLLILCSPILAIVDTIKKLGAMELPAGLVVTDIGSTKKVIADAAREYLPPRVRFIGGHPMAGSEKSGVEASDSDLFKDAAYVLTPTGDGDHQTAAGLAGFLQKFLGCRVTMLDPSVHDSMAAAVSHLPHVLASALVLCANEQEKHFPGTLALAAGGFRDTTRIASASYDIWHDIFATNKGAIIPLIDAYIDTLSGMKAKLADDALRESFEAAREIRDSMKGMER